MSFRKVDDGALHVVHYVDVVGCLQVRKIYEFVQLVRSVEATGSIQGLVCLGSRVDDLRRRLGRSIGVDEFGLTGTVAPDLSDLLLRLRLLYLDG